MQPTQAQPNLAPWITAELANYPEATWSNDNVYGLSLPAAIRQSGSEWLEGAVLAGHLPHLDGIQLALLAFRSQTLDEIDLSCALGVDGDGLFAASAAANDLRALVALAETAISDLEYVAAEIFRSGRALDPAEAELEAGRAERRAGRAKVRRSSALTDTSSDL